MDLTFLSLPDDMCRLISKMKSKLESPPEPLLKEIRERKPKVYKHYNNFGTNDYEKNHLYFGVEALEWSTSGGEAWEDEKNRKFRMVRRPDYGYRNSWGYYYVANPTFHLFREIYYEEEETRLYLNNVRAMKVYLIYNNIKFKSNLDEDGLRSLCLSF